ncbi:tryptophan 2,3-dioxygenase family protein [Microbacterium sp. KUDC0406]|uniref:tryptophan 2,3-dioxygenase n=1 Tax=Microbacterium sp. KUDC0406 TaxID=2909588 RepID=UPI001F285829|nr:tryptophan 2,3-dioxygenase family protein [Microbacterium sp. KUDC0406]UJP10185.1 tryptophan 2,3-dioxygenase family protein [Microbacterium sp. KUDC0406]
MATDQDNGTGQNERALEDGIVTDLKNRMTYGSYLDLDRLLGAQHPVSVPEHHDEMLFIIQHQTTELWLKLVLRELQTARTRLAEDDLRAALKHIARIKHIQEVLTQQWSVLATLTPTEYAEFRGDLGNSSGFQSVQYRAVEFALGNKNERMLGLFRDHPENLALLTAELERPTLYDEFLRYVARRGLPVPASILERDVRLPYRETPDLVPVIREVYEDPKEHWELYEACEELVDVEDNFQFWRFRHLRTVTRTIGMKRGTGGSTGVDFLQRALSLTFFPELYTVRTEIGKDERIGR